MKSRTLLRLFTLVTLSLALLAVWFKLDHLSWGSYYLGGVIVFTAAFIVAGINAVVRNHRLSGTEKLVWIAGFLFAWPLAGIAYSFFSHPKVRVGHTAN